MAGIQITGLSDEFERRGGTQDADAAKRAQIEQIAVAGYDEIGMAAERSGKDRVVIEIGGDGRRNTGRYRVLGEIAVARDHFCGG